MFNSHGCVFWSLTIGSSNSFKLFLSIIQLFLALTDRTVVVDLCAFQGLFPCFEALKAHQVADCFLV